MIPRTRNPVSLLAAAGLVLAACGDDDASDMDDAGTSAETSGGSEDPQATVVATTSIWADVVTSATCGDESGIEVVTLIPSDADPHDYEPSMQDRETLEEADLVVANGLDLEAGYEDLLSTVGDDQLVEVADLEGVDVRDGEDGDHEHDDDHDHEDGDHDHEHEHDHSEGDPHLWMDPLMVSAAVHPLADAVGEAAGQDAEQIERCADDYVDELEVLDGEIAELIEEVPEDRRALVTNHDAYGYFADHYGLEIVGTVLPSSSTLAETNPADLDELRVEIEETRARAIVVDAGHVGEDAEALADSIEGIEVVTLSTGGLGDQDSYIEMMRSNATALADALES